MFTSDLNAGVVPQMLPLPHDLERIRTTMVDFIVLSIKLVFMVLGVSYSRVLAQRPTGCCSAIVMIPNFTMRYVSRYLGHDAIRIAILVYRVRQCLDLHLSNGNAIYIICLGTLYSVTTISAECAGRRPSPCY